MTPESKTDRHAALAAALVAFQAEITDVGKESTAKIQPRDKSKPPFSFPYADLATVLTHVRPVLARHGLAVFQDVTTKSDGALVSVSTIVLHESGERMEYGPLALAAGDDNKQAGGSITSARRFAVMAALGITSVGEDAGDEGGGRRGGAGSRATGKQLAKIAAEVERGHVTDAELAKVLTRYQVQTTAALDKAQASDLIDRLVAEADRRAAAASAGADPVTGEVAPGEGEEPPGLDAEGFRRSTGASSGEAPAPGALV